jgi:hypothetical protein
MHYYVSQGYGEHHHTRVLHPPTSRGWTSIFFFLPLPLTACTHMQIQIKRQLKHLKKERKGRRKMCEKRMCFQVIQPKNVFGFGATLLDTGVLLEYANVWCIRYTIQHLIWTMKQNPFFLVWCWHRAFFKPNIHFHNKTNFCRRQTSIILI